MVADARIKLKRFSLLWYYTMTPREVVESKCAGSSRAVTKARAIPSSTHIPPPHFCELFHLLERESVPAHYGGQFSHADFLQEDHDSVQLPLLVHLAEQISEGDSLVLIPHVVHGLGVGDFGLLLLEVLLWTGEGLGDRIPVDCPGEGLEAGRSIPVGGGGDAAIWSPRGKGNIMHSIFYTQKRCLERTN